MQLNCFGASPATLEELLSYHDERFINNAYLALLGRNADPEGLRYYVAKLRAGTGKLEILSELQKSAEGKARQAKIAYFNESIRAYQRQMAPFQGWLMRLAGDSNQEEFTAIEDKLYTIDAQAQDSFDDVDKRFIRSAYHTILARAPDHAGQRFYLQSLKEGIPKVEILSQLYKSAEACTQRTNIAELTKAIRVHQRLKLPLIGVLLRLMGQRSKERSNTEYLRAIENNLHILNSGSGILQKKMLALAGNLSQFDVSGATLRQSLHAVDQTLHALDLNVRQQLTDLRTAIDEIERITKSVALARNTECSAAPLQSAPVESRSQLANFEGSTDVRSLNRGVVILATKHTFYVALLIERTLNNFGFDDVTILASEPYKYEHKVHVVICPQMFSKMPGYYIAFQMEQSVSSRWFTKDYFNLLESSAAILDYSIENIKYLQSNGLSYRQIFWTPISNIENFQFVLAKHNVLNTQAQTHFEYDVVFYGDANCPRRHEFLTRISKRFKLLKVSEVFGGDLYRELKKARIVLNIHYYENALLETTRIFECLSLGLNIISEESADLLQHTNLSGYVTFVAEGDIEGMLDAISVKLSSSDILKKQMDDDLNKFDYYFGRVLVALDLMPLEKLSGLKLLSFVELENRIVLTLPETYQRRDSFCSMYPAVTEFHGLRHIQGWLGCAMSYSYLCKQALKQDISYLEVCEDDVEFNSAFTERWKIIRRYLFNNLGTRNWDIFCGMIADVSDDTVILDVINFEGLTFVFLDRMTSMVFNVYGQNAIKKIAEWDSSNRDVTTNTIDRYLERSATIKIVTTIPFVVGHLPDPTSTLWHFQNSTYDGMIEKSEKKLIEKVDVFLKMRSEVQNRLLECDSYPLDKSAK